MQAAENEMISTSLPRSLPLPPLARLDANFARSSQILNVPQEPFIKPPAPPPRHTAFLSDQGT